MKGNVTVRVTIKFIIVYKSQEFNIILQIENNTNNTNNS